MLDSIYKEALKLEEPGRPPEIRPSSMPFCPNKFLLQNLDYLNGNVNWSFCGDFYCDIGTAIHSTLQKWLPRAYPGVIVGNWYCKKCKHKIIGEVGPIICRCGHPMIYDEFIIKFEDAKAEGHCDGILLDYEFIKAVYGFNPAENPAKVNKLIKNKKLKHKIPAYILEYKSTGFWFIKNAKKPKNEHRCQATVYCSAFNKAKVNYHLHGIDMQGIIIKYYSRENPKSTTEDFIIKVKKDSMYNVMCGIINIIHNIINHKSKKALEKAYNLQPCKKYPIIYEKCEFESICRDYDFDQYRKDWKRIVKELPHLKTKYLEIF